MMRLILCNILEDYMQYAARTPLRFLRHLLTHVAL